MKHVACYFFLITFITLVRTLLSATIWWNKMRNQTLTCYWHDFNWLRTDIFFSSCLMGEWCFFPFVLNEMCYNECPCQTWLNWWEAVRNDNRGLFTCAPGGPGFPFVTTAVWSKEEHQKTQLKSEMTNC